MKRCTKCGGAGPFHRDQDRPGGFKTQCKRCVNAHSVAYKRRHRQDKGDSIHGIVDPEEIGRRLARIAELKRWVCGVPIRLDVIDAVLS